MPGLTKGLVEYDLMGKAISRLGSRLLGLGPMGRRSPPAAKALTRRLPGLDFARFSRLHWLPPLMVRNAYADVGSLSKGLGVGRLAPESFGAMYGGFVSESAS